MAKQKMNYIVEIIYPAEFWSSEKDDAIDHLANGFSGERTASGMGFGQRDMQFEFDNANSAERFAEIVSKIEHVTVQ